MIIGNQLEISTPLRKLLPVLNKRIVDSDGDPFWSDTVLLTKGLVNIAGSDLALNADQGTVTADGDFMSFPGAASLYIDGTTNLLAFQAPITLEFDIQPVPYGDTGTARMLLSEMESGAGYETYIRGNANLGFYAANNSVYQEGNSGTNVACLLCMTYDAGVLTFYRNGILQLTGACNDLNVSTNPLFYIGRESSSDSAKYYQGKMRIRATKALRYSGNYTPETWIEHG